MVTISEKYKYTITTKIYCNWNETALQKKLKGITKDGNQKK